MLDNKILLDKELKIKEVDYEKENLLEEVSIKFKNMKMYKEKYRIRLWLFETPMNCCVIIFLIWLLFVFPGVILFQLWLTIMNGLAVFPVIFYCCLKITE